MRPRRLSWLALLLVLVLLAPGAAWAQDPPQPAGTVGGIQPAPADDEDADAEAAAREAAAKEARERHRRTDPYLQYVKDAEIRISQLELSDFPTVRAFVSVTDENGVLLRSLTEQDFTVSENDVPAAEVRFANREALDLPLAIQLVLDISGSMQQVVDEDTGTTALDLAKQAVRDFVAQLEPRDRVGLITFSDAAIADVRLGTDRVPLLRELDQLSPWGQTALWDAIFVAMEELVGDTQPARRAIIVLSDGWDNKSVETPLSILQWYEDEALENNIGFSIYTLGLGTEIDRDSLDNIATRTGGLYLDSPTADQLADVYEDILNQIQSEYLLEWESPAASQPGQIIDVSIDITAVQSARPGTYTYRSPGLSAALGRALLPGLLTIAVLIAILVIATIFRISRRAWLTVMITPLEGKDYAIGEEGADIGTLESCEVRLAADPALLPLHASLRESSDGFVLAAVDPQSPIISGGQLLARKLLRSGDRFTLGTTNFIFNERVARPGDGESVLAEYVTDLHKEPALTEAAQQAAAEGGAPAAQAVEHRAPSAMVGLAGPYSGQRFELHEGATAIGRSEGQITLPNDTQVSRRHCTISISGGQATVTDDGSTNGTFLNGQRCQPGMAQPLWAGDTLRLGQGEYRLE